MANHRLGLHHLAYHLSQGDWEHFERMQYRSAKPFEWSWSNAGYCNNLLATMPQDAYILARDHPKSEQKEAMWADPVGTGQRHANEWADKVRSGQYRLPIDRSFFLGINEADATTGDRVAIDRYTETYLVRLQQHGLRGGAFSFSTGHPRTVDGTGNTLADYSVFESSHAAIVRGHHIAVLHIYGSSQMPLVPGHFDRLRACPWQDVTWIVGECGIDEHVTSGAGHYGYKGILSGEEYCRWLDTLIMGVNDSRIHSWQVFTYDFSHPWATFDIAPIRADLERYPWQHGAPVSRPTVVQPTPPTPPPPPSIAQNMYVNSPDGLIVRVWPGVNRARVKGLAHGEQVTVHETHAGEDGRLWARVDDGWVAHWLLSETPPQPVVEPPPPVSPRPIGVLVHPVENPAYRRVTQPFGARPEFYRQFFIDGVALKGHEGIDFGTPVGVTIRAVDSGVVSEVTDQGAVGYGRHIKIVHPWGESVYAHLQTFLVVIGATVAAGQPIALSGNTGNSDGPHLHLGLRVSPYDRRDGWGGYTDPAPYLSNVGESPVDPAPPANIVATVREAAREFGVDQNLMLSLAHAESSYNPAAVSPAGAQGLFQVMPATWQEQAPKVGATDPFNARDSARVAANYYKWLVGQLGNDWSALAAWNFGIGNILALRPPPTETVIFIRSVLHGRDLLRAVLP